MCLSEPQARRRPASAQQGTRAVRCFTAAAGKAGRLGDRNASPGRRAATALGEGCTTGMARFRQEATVQLPEVSGVWFSWLDCSWEQSGSRESLIAGESPSSAPRLGLGKLESSRPSSRPYFTGPPAMGVQLGPVSSRVTIRRPSTGVPRIDRPLR